MSQTFVFSSGRPEKAAESFFYFIIIIIIHIHTAINVISKKFSEIKDERELSYFLGFNKRNPTEWII